MYLPKGSIMKWNGNGITEHNRDALDINYDRIETADRTANGTMRKYVTATKVKLSTSWNLIPTQAAKTVDGKWGAQDMKDFYETYPGSLSVTVYDGQTTKTYLMFISSFNASVKKRGGATSLWDVSVELEEI